MLNFCEIDFQVRHKIQRVLLRFALPGKLLCVLIRRLVKCIRTFFALNKQDLPSAPDVLRLAVQNIRYIINGDL